MGKPNQIRIGDLLIANNIISDQQLQNSLKNQKITGLKLGQQLVQDGYIKQSQLNAFLAKQLNIAYIDLHNFDLRKEIVQQIPELVCRRLRVIALGTGRDGSMVVGMADPTDIFGYDELTRVLGRQIRQAVVDEDVLLESIDRFFRKSQEMGGIAEELGNSTETADEKRADTFNVEDVVGDAPVVRFLQTMFEDAVQINASDIHIEPDEKKLQIRLRQDGVLHVQLTAEKRIATPLLSRLKLLANLDISEKRLPQDGRFNIQVLNQNIDVRLSTIPIQGGGESAVMRLLIQTGRVLNLDASGMPPPVLTHLREIIRSPHGVLLVSGPTGSGKTTTLYSVIKELNKPETKILTVEDPVEYRMSGINQVQINTKIGLDFPDVLRAFLRQDPDIILVGEMRDQETVTTAMRAAMTGHLVLSTVHTNSAISTPLRLIDMGAEPFLIGAGLRGVLGQRLLRKICEHCAEPYTVASTEREILTRWIGGRVDKIRFMHGRGCNNCNRTGYKGRVGIYELLKMNGELSRLINERRYEDYLKAAVSQPGYKSLNVCALELAARGTTSLEEVFRVTYSVD